MTNKLTESGYNLAKMCKHNANKYNINAHLTTTHSRTTVGQRRCTAVAKIVDTPRNAIKFFKNYDN